MPPTGPPAPKKTLPRQTQELRSIHHVLIQAWYPTHSHLHSPPDPHPAPLGRMDHPTKLTRGKGADRPFLRGVASVTDATILGDRLESLALAPPAEDVPLV